MNQRLPQRLPEFIWHFLKPYRYQLLGLFLPMVYSAIHLSFEPYVLKLLIDRVMAYTGNLPDLVQEESSLVILFVLQGIVLIGVWRIKDYFSLRILPSVKSRIMGELFSDVSLHSHRFYQENFAGNIANKIKEVATAVEDLVENSREIFRQFSLVIIAVLMMIFVHLQLAAILLGWAILFICSGYLLSRRIVVFSETFAEIRSVAFGKIVDSITNHSNVRLFSRNQHEREFLEKFFSQTNSEDRKLRIEFIKLWTVQGLLAVLMLGLMLFSLLYLRSKQIVSLGDFAFVMWVSVHVIDQVWMLTEILSKMPQHWGVCSQGLKLIMASHEITDPPGASQLQVVSSRVQFQGVQFSYSPSKKLFKDLNIEIEPGTKVGLVGFSGSGKSTFVHLLVRLFDLQGGRILIDGQDISLVTQDSLRKNISFIPQDPSLFHRSLMENIRYGKMGATDAEVIEAAKKAHAHEFILGTPGGYASLVGERGIKLSGGQRQRIAIARAILKDAPVLILDEATSALDTVTERLIQESLETLMQGKTCFVVAHRLSTLLNMDRILVFDQGRIIEDGTHSELLNNKGLYEVLWKSQVGGVVPDSSEMVEADSLSSEAFA